MDERSQTEKLTSREPDTAMFRTIYGDDERTLELEKPPPAEGRRRSRGVQRLVLLAVLGAVLGVGGRLAWAAATNDGEAADPGEVVAQIPFDPNGNEATFDKGAGKVTVPKGAVSEPQTVTVYKQVIPQRVRAVPPSGGQPLVFPPGALVTYVFSPITLRLNVPITVTTDETVVHSTV
jgi:hypothetical protein